MQQFKLNTTYKKLLADTTTPVSIYLRLRDIFPNSLLLESSDYHSRDNSLSFICCEPIAGMVLNKGVLTQQFPDGSEVKFNEGEFNLVDEIDAFLKRFETDTLPIKIISNGLFGYFTHEAVEHYETIRLKKVENDARQIPEMQYHVYRYIIAVDHFKNELYIFQNQYGEPADDKGIEKMQYLLKSKDFPEYYFQSKNEEQSNLTDQGFMDIVEKMKQHIYRGDVFQIVPSRAFSQAF